MSFPCGISRGETLRNAYRNNWLRSYGRPRIVVVDQQRSLCSGIFADKVESDGTRLETTPLEAPWRNGKTERAGKDWKEYFYKMTQDGPEAQTWTDFEEDCDAVNQARASKINDGGYRAYQRVFGRNPTQMEDANLECGRSRPRCSEPADRRTGTGTADEYEAPCPTGKSSLGPRTSMETSPCTTQRNTTRANCTLDNPSGFGDVERMPQKKPTSAFWHPGVVISSTLATVWIAYRGSVVKCARSQARPINEDDEAAHEHVTEHVRDLGERSLHEGDFSYEDITGHEEPQWTYQHQKKTQRQDIKNPMEENKWMWTQNLEDVCEEKPD